MAERVVFKYPLTVDTNQLPLGDEFQVLHVGLDPQNVLCLWALVDPAAPPTCVAICIQPTGLKFEAFGWKFAGTFIDGGFVGHVFVGDYP